MRRCSSVADRTGLGETKEKDPKGRETQRCICCAAHHDIVPEALRIFAEVRAVPGIPAEILLKLEELASKCCVLFEKEATVLKANIYFRHKSRFVWLPIAAFH